MFEKLDECAAVEAQTDAQIKTQIVLIVDACHRHGVQVSSDDAENIWKKYSAELCAEWIALPKNSAEIARIIIAQAASISLVVMADGGEK